MNQDNEKIANRIKAFRKEHDLSQGELAAALGISRQSVIALEQGRSLPSLPLVITICQYFDSTFEDIFIFHKEIEAEMEHIADEINDNIIKILPHEEPEGDPTSPVLRGAERNTMGSEMEPWKPFREVVSLRDAMDRLFEDSVITPRGMAMPKIDIKDQKDSIVVKAELPGMKEDEIDVEIADGVMTISGEKKEEKEEKSEGYYHKESHSGSFSRSFTLPAEVKEDKAVADMKNGILTITVPKIEPKKATKIKIEKK